MEKVGERIYMIDTKALGEEKTVASYLIKDEKTALTEIGYASSLNNLLDGLREAGVNPRSLNYIVLTHIHLDHAGAAGKLAEIASDAVIYVHPRGAPHLINPEKLVRSVRDVYGEFAERLGEVIPIPPDRIVEASDGEEISLGSTTLKLIYAPGHAPHHMVVYDLEEKALFSGDALPMRFPDFPLTVPTTPPPSYLHELTIDTIRKLSKLGGKVVMKPHYGPSPWSDEFFEEQVNVLEEWRKLALRIIREGCENPYERVFEEFADKAGQPVPEHVKRDLRISFDGIRMYFERIGVVSTRR